MAWWLRLCWRTAHHLGEGCAGWFASVLFQPWGAGLCMALGKAGHGLSCGPAGVFVWFFSLVQLHEELCVCGCNLEKSGVGNAPRGY